MPTNPASMQPFVLGLNPSGRRILVLLPCGDEEVGIILATTILSMECDGGILTFTVQEYVNKEMRLAAVVFDIAAGEMFTDDDAPCYFVVDDSLGHHIIDMKEILILRHPEARLATV